MQFSGSYFISPLNVWTDEKVKTVAHFSVYFKPVCFLFQTNLCLQLTLALLQLGDASGTLRHHGLLLLQRKLQLNVLLVGAPANQGGTAELLLQGESLRGDRDSANMETKEKRGEIERRPGGV